MASAAFAGAALPAAAKAAQPELTKDSKFTYEVTRTEAEWRAQLTDAEYEVLRDRQTEPRHSSAYWNETAPGDYYCKGCGLHAYTYEWQVPLDKGWVFFVHSIPNAILMDIDTEVNYSGMDTGEVDRANLRTAIEAHCRRCGSHLGHILQVDGLLLHCINGTSLIFEPKTA